MDRRLTHLVFLLLLLHVDTVIPDGVVLDDDYLETYRSNGTAVFDADEELFAGVISCEDDQQVALREHRNNEHIRSKRFVLDAIGAVSSVIGIFDFFFNLFPKEDPVETALENIGTKLDSLQAMQKKLMATLVPMLEQMRQKLDAIVTKLEDLKKHVSLEGMRNQLKDSEKIIRNSLKHSIAFAKSGSNYARNNFVATAGNAKLENAISDILDGLGDGGVFASDVLVVLRDAENNHARKFLKAANNIRELVATGAAVLATFFRFVKMDQPYVAHWRNETTRKDATIGERMRRIEVEDCRREDGGKAAKDMEKIMSDYAGETHEKVAQLLYDHLSDKYDTSLWLVAVKREKISIYTQVKRPARTHQVLGVGGKDAIAFSFDRNDVAASGNECRAKVSEVAQQVQSAMQVVMLTDHATVVVEKELDSLGFGNDNTVLMGVDSKRQPGLEIGLEVRHHPALCYGKHLAFSRNYELQLTMLLVPGGNSSASTTTHDGRRYFRLRSKLNGLVVDDSTVGSTQPGGLVHMLPIHGGYNQWWYFDGKMIRSLKTDLCLSSNGT